MARRSMRVADIKEILVHWDGGEAIAQIARSLGYSRPTVRKYARAAQRAGLCRGSRGHDETAWDQLAATVLAAVTEPRPPGAATAAVAGYHAYLRALTRATAMYCAIVSTSIRSRLSSGWGTSQAT